MMRYTPILFITFPLSAFAQDGTAGAPLGYKLIAPIGETLTVVNSLGEYLDAMYKIGVSVAAVLAVVMLVICGIKLMTTEMVSSKDEAKKCIENALGGLVLALVAYLILNTINPNLLKSDVDIPTSPTAIMGTQEATEPDLPTQSGWYLKYQQPNKTVPVYNKTPFPSREACLSYRDSIASQDSNYIILKDCFEVTKSPVSQSEIEARTRLCGNENCFPGGSGNLASNPAVNKAACKTTTQANCTNVAGLPVNTIDFIKSLALNYCGCRVVVTGGTETGHKSHGIGMAIFDLSLNENDEFTKFIYKNGTNKKGDVGMSEPSFSGNRAWKYKNYWFVDEKSGRPRHWHVCAEGATEQPACVGKSIAGPS